MNWHEAWFSAFILSAIFLTLVYHRKKQLFYEEKHKLMKQFVEQYEQAQLEKQKELRTPQECVNEYRSNPGHRYLTRSERRRRERLLEKLKKTWSQDQNQERSRSHSIVRDPVNNHRRHPALKQFSRITRQLPQPQPQSTHPEFRINWHQLHLFYNKLCIYTALPLLTFCVFCHHLRINLTEPEEESDDTEFSELDPV